MGMTMTQKILAAHAGLEKVEAGPLIRAKLDIVLGNDITTPVAVNEFKKAGFDKVFDKALASIKKYETTNPRLYESLKNRIMKERLSPIYIKMTLLSSYYSEEEIEEMRKEFKYYVNLFKLSESMEGIGFGDMID